MASICPPSLAFIRHASRGPAPLRFLPIITRLSPNGEPFMGRATARPSLNSFANKRQRHGFKPSILDDCQCRKLLTTCLILIALTTQTALAKSLRNPSKTCDNARTYLIPLVSRITVTFTYFSGCPCTFGRTRVNTPPCQFISITQRRLISTYVSERKPFLLLSVITLIIGCPALGIAI